MSDSHNINVYSKHTANQGNGLFASGPLLPGELIFGIDQPPIAVPDTPRLDDTCSNCFVWTPRDAVASQGDAAEEAVLSKCAGCQTVRYCSKTCQAQSWKAHHKYECELYAKLHPRILPNVARAAIRFIRLLNAYPGLSGLQSHCDTFRKADEERWETLCVMAKGVKEYSGTSYEERTVREVVGRILINSLTLVTPTYDPIGICIDPLAATMNHSCNPNAVVSFDGPTLNVRSLKKISKDEEILISYVDITYNPWQRQEELRKRYLFTCDCVECSAGTILQSSAIAPDNEQFRNIESQAKALLETAKASSDNNASITALERGMRFMREVKVCPVFCQPYASLRQQLAVNLTTAHRWVSAFAHMLKIYFEIDPVLFPQPFHPVRVVHKWTLAMLVIHISTLSMSEAGSVGRLEVYHLDYGTVVWGLLTEVEGNLDKSLGRGTRFAKMVRRKVDQVKVDMTRGDAAVPTLGKQEVEKHWSTMRKIAEDLAP